MAKTHDKAPDINMAFFCVVDNSNIELAAVISSYLNRPGEYTPLFGFPRVTKASPKSDNIDLDEDYISITGAREFSTRLNNALVIQGGCENLILGGLSEDQKSYLYFLEHYNVIEIDAIENVDFMLQGLGGKTDYLACNSQDIHNGLYIAAMNNSMLQIDDSAEDLPIIRTDNSGLIVSEMSETLSSVVAVNYAFSVESDYLLIEKPKTDSKEIRYLIEAWKTKRDDKYFNDLSALIYDPIADIDFRQYEFCTFFTFGAPYSLILENSIPFTYVNNQLRSDFFIYNNLISSKSSSPFAAIVFSPLEFKDEETDFLINKLEDNAYYVRSLVGEKATSFNIDFHVKEFPFQLLHFCSHGGETDGYYIIQEFEDSQGNKHTIEYDEVVSFAPDKSEELIPVTTKKIFRVMDGLAWGSKELKEKYPHSVFADMMKATRGIEKDNRVKKSKIIDSCAIVCSDFNYQAMFNRLAGDYTKPFVFNNTCWSWSCISEAFLSTGTTGYIGTLWAVDNDIAKLVAESFYEKAFDETILNSLQAAIPHTKGTGDEHIYIYWGLHFSSLSKGVSKKQSKKQTASKILNSFYAWRQRYSEVEDEQTKEQISKLINWNFLQLRKHFPKEALQLVFEMIKRGSG